MTLKEIAKEAGLTKEEINLNRFKNHQWKLSKCGKQRNAG